MKERVRFFKNSRMYLIVLTVVFISIEFIYINNRNSQIVFLLMYLGTILYIIRGFYIVKHDSIIVSKGIIKREYYLKNIKAASPVIKMKVISGIVLTYIDGIYDKKIFIPSEDLSSIITALKQWGVPLAGNYKDYLKETAKSYRKEYNIFSKDK